MEKDKQLTALVQQCYELPVCIRSVPDALSVTVSIPPPWNAITELKAIQTQKTIKEWSKQYPDVILYCFDSFSMLLYVL